jgi:hypothetical protein
MRTVAQVVELIAHAIGPYREGDQNPIKELRYRGLEQVRGYLSSHGWPESREDRLALSLVPLIFQEANYDDIEWTVQAAPLGGLEPLWGIDVLVQSKGRTRAELSEDEFSKYIELCLARINPRRR